MHRRPFIAALTCLVAMGMASAQTNSQTSDEIRKTLRNDWVKLAEYDRKDKEYGYVTSFLHQSEGDMRSRSGTVVWFGGKIKVMQEAAGARAVFARNDRYEFAVSMDNNNGKAWQLECVVPRQSGLRYETSDLFSVVNYQCLFPFSSILGDPPETTLDMEGMAFTKPAKDERDQWIISATRVIRSDKQSERKTLKYEFQVDPSNHNCVLSAKIFVDGRLFLASRRSVSGSGEALVCTGLTYELWDEEGSKVTDIATELAAPAFRKSNNPSEFYLEAYGIFAEPSEPSPARRGLWHYALGFGASLVIGGIIARKMKARR